MKSLLDKMKDGQFTGYLITGMTLDGDTTNGVIGVEAGKAILAIYAFRPSGNNSGEMMYRGERAVGVHLRRCLMPRVAARTACAQGRVGGEEGPGAVQGRRRPPASPGQLLP